MLNRRKTRSTPNLSPHERAERQVMSETKNLSTGLLRLIGTLVALYERPASPERELAISMTLMAAAERYRSSSVYAYFVLTAQQILLGKTAPFGLTLEGLKEAVPQVWQRVDAMLARCRAAIERETPLGNKLANSTLNQINTVERGLSEGKPIEEVFGEIVEEAKQNAQRIIADMLGVPADRLVRSMVSLGYATEAGAAPKSPKGEARKPFQDVVRYERFS